MYFVITSYCQAPDIVKPYFKDHCAWLHKCIENRVFLASGPKKSGLGGAFIAKSMPRSELDAIIAEDPYHKAGVADYLIVEMDCKLAVPELEYLLT